MKSSTVPKFPVLNDHGAKISATERFNRSVLEFLVQNSFRTVQYRKFWYWFKNDRSVPKKMVPIPKTHV